MRECGGDAHPMWWERTPHLSVYATKCDGDAHPSLSIDFSLAYSRLNLALIHSMGKVEFPGCYAAHQLADGRWEVVVSDDDPFRPPCRRVVVVSLKNARTMNSNAQRAVVVVSYPTTTTARKK